MKPSEIREMNADEILRKVDELKQELFNLRFQHGIGQLENPRKIKETKCRIARLRTVLRERELAPTAN